MKKRTSLDKLIINLAIICLVLLAVNIFLKFHYILVIAAAIAFIIAIMEIYRKVQGLERTLIPAISWFATATMIFIYFIRIRKF